MPRENISFKTSDGVTLHGWFYPSATKLDHEGPCLVMSHGFSAIKEMGLDDYAEAFQAGLPTLSILVYDHRGLGASGTGTGQVRSEIIPAEQNSDMQDAITFAQLQPEVDPEKIGIWGSSYSGGHVLYVAAVDKRVRAVISQVPAVDGLQTLRRLIRPDAGIEAIFQADRHARAQGKEPAFMPIVAKDAAEPAALPMKDAYDFFMEWDSRTTGWQNKVSVRSIELLRGYRPGLVIDCISPTPLLMVVAESDAVMTPADLCLEAYARAREPKELLILKGEHFDVYRSENLERAKARQTEFLGKTICS